MLVEGHKNSDQFHYNILPAHVTTSKRSLLDGILKISWTMGGLQKLHFPWFKQSMHMWATVMPSHCYKGFLTMGLLWVWYGMLPKSRDNNHCFDHGTLNITLSRRLSNPEHLSAAGENRHAQVLPSKISWGRVQTGDLDVPTSALGTIRWLGNCKWLLSSPLNREYE